MYCRSKNSSVAALLKLVRKTDVRAELGAAQVNDALDESGTGTADGATKSSKISLIPQTWCAIFDKFGTSKVGEPTFAVVVK